MNLDGKIEEKSGQVYYVFEHEKQQFPVFLRILHDGDLLQLLTFIPCTVNLDTVQDMARFLHMANKELDMPGFCLDENSLTVFYRLLLPSQQKKFDEDLLQAYLGTGQTICKNFATVIEALAIGAMNLEEILAKVNEMKSAQGK